MSDPIKVSIPSLTGGSSHIVIEVDRSKGTVHVSGAIEVCSHYEVDPQARSVDVLGLHEKAPSVTTRTHVRRGDLTTEVLIDPRLIPSMACPQTSLNIMSGDSPGDAKVIFIAQAGHGADQRNETLLNRTIEWPPEAVSFP